MKQNGFLEGNDFWKLCIIFGKSKVAFEGKKLLNLKTALTSLLFTLLFSTRNVACDNTTLQVSNKLI